DHAGQCGDRIRANRSRLCRPTRWTNADDQRLVTEFAVSIFLSARADGLSRSPDSCINGFDDRPGSGLACALILSLLQSAWISTAQCAVMPAAALNAPSHATEIGAVPPKLGDDAPSAADTERGERDQSKGGRPQNHGHTLEARSISPQCNNGNGV